MDNVIGYYVSVFLKSKSGAWPVASIEYLWLGDTDGPTRNSGAVRTEIYNTLGNPTLFFTPLL